MEFILHPRFQCFHFLLLQLPSCLNQPSCMRSLSGGFIVNSRSNICMSGPMRCFKSLRFEKTCFHHQKAQMEESVSEPVGVRGTYKRPVKWEKKDLLLWQMLQHSWSETRMGLCKVTATVTYGLLPIRQKTSSHPLLPSLCMFRGSESLPVFYKHQRAHETLCSCSLMYTSYTVLHQHLDWI